MHIANPIYDVVFKYLMEDNRIAKLLISSIIKQEIESIEILPQENISEIAHTSLTVYRLDLKAKVKTPEGWKTVLIEIQKAKFAADIMRFRQYLGENYQDKKNAYVEIINDKNVKKAIPLICIYFLGYRLDHIQNAIIKAEPQYIDIATGERILEREEFIESLTHNSYIIQIPQLKEKRRTELEQLLIVFDQSNVTSDSHILNIKEEDYPENYREIIRRLQRAIAEPEMRRKMNLEDEIIEELQENERYIAFQQKKLEEKDKSLEEKDKLIKEKDKLIDELTSKLNKISDTRTGNEKEN